MCLYQTLYHATYTPIAQHHALNSPLHHHVAYELFSKQPLLQISHPAVNCAVPITHTVCSNGTSFVHVQHFTSSPRNVVVWEAQSSMECWRQRPLFTPSERCSSSSLLLLLVSAASCSSLVFKLRCCSLSSLFSKMTSASRFFACLAFPLLSCTVFGSRRSDRLPLSAADTVVTPTVAMEWRMRGSMPMMMFLVFILYCMEMLYCVLLLIC